MISKLLKTDIKRDENGVYIKEYQLNREITKKEVDEIIELYDKDKEKAYDKYEEHIHDVIETMDIIDITTKNIKNEL